MSRKYQEIIQIFWKYDDQLQYKSIIEAALVSITARFINNSLMSLGPYMTARNPITRKSVRLFIEVLDAKKKNAVCGVGATKSKLKTIR